jgi:hypothetical protein
MPAKRRPSSPSHCASRTSSSKSQKHQRTKASRPKAGPLPKPSARSCDEAVIGTGPRLLGEVAGASPMQGSKHMWQGRLWRKLRGRNSSSSIYRKGPLQLAQRPHSGQFKRKCHSLFHTAAVLPARAPQRQSWQMQLELFLGRLPSLIHELAYGDGAMSEALNS